MKCTVCLLLLMAELPLVAEVVSVEDISAFDARRNVYSAGDGAKARWTSGGALEIVAAGASASVSPSSWMGAYPGQAPFPGADAFVLTAPVAPDGVRVTMELGEFPKGGKVRLEAKLDGRIPFSAKSSSTAPARARSCWRQ